MPEPKPNRSPAAGNHADDVRMTLNAKFEDRYLFIQLSGPRGGIAALTDSSQFRGQIVNMQPSTVGEVEDVPTVQQVFALCYVLEFWFAWSDDHVAVVSCRDGLYRSSFFLAAYLAYTEKFPDTVSAFEACSRAICGENCGFPWRSWRQALIHLAYLVRIPPAPPNVHLVRRIILRMEGLLALVDTPPTVRIVQDNEEIFDSSEEATPPKWDEGALTVDVNRIVSGDVQILILADPWEAREVSRVRRGERLRKGERQPQPGDGSDDGMMVEQFKLIARFAWHTSIVPSGVCIPIPVNEKTGMDVFERELIDPEELYMDVLLDVPESLKRVINPRQDFGLNRCLGLRGDVALWQGAKELSQDHQEIPDGDVFTQCEERQYLPQTENAVVLAMVTIQCCRNDSEAVREVLQLPMFQRLATETFPEYLNPPDPETVPEGSPVMDAFSPSPSNPPAEEPAALTHESAVQTTPTVEQQQRKADPSLAIRRPETAEDAVQTTPSLGNSGLGTVGDPSSLDPFSQQVWDRIVSLPESSTRLQEVLRILDMQSPTTLQRKSRSSATDQEARKRTGSPPALASEQEADAPSLPEPPIQGDQSSSPAPVESGAGRGALLAAIRKQGTQETGRAVGTKKKGKSGDPDAPSTAAGDSPDSARANVLNAIKNRKRDSGSGGAAAGDDGDARASLLAAIEKRGTEKDSTGARDQEKGASARQNLLSAIRQRKPDAAPSNEADSEVAEPRQADPTESADKKKVEEGEGDGPSAEAPRGGEGSAAVPAKKNPTYGRFFSMLRVGVPQPAVEQKMQAEGLDPSALALDPEQPIPPEYRSNQRDSFEGKLKDHPDIAKFFKMLQVGVPPPAVKMKMEQAKFNPALLDCNPEEPLPEAMRDQVSLKPAKPKRGGGRSAAARKGPSIARRRLVWDPLPDTSNPEMWADVPRTKLAASDETKPAALRDDDPARRDFDRSEFERLFTKTREPSKSKVASASAGKRDEASNEPVVLSHKRAMNASIVLSKVTAPPEVVRSCLLRLCAAAPDGPALDGQTLRALESVLPTEEEARLFRKTHKQLNDTERFLAHVADVPGPRERAAALAFQAELPPRTCELEERAQSIREASERVLHCEALPRVLGWVLRLGHWMNNHPVRDPLHVRGLSLPSLSLLWSTKSFQNDVTALGFLVQQLHAVGDTTALELPESLSHVSQARMWSLDQLLYDMEQMRTEQASMEAIVRDDARQAGGWARRARTISQLDAATVDAANDGAAEPRAGAGGGDGSGGDEEVVGRSTSRGSSDFRDRIGSVDDSTLTNAGGGSPGSQPLTRFVPHAQRRLRRLQDSVDAAAGAFSTLQTQLGAPASLPFEEVFGHLHDFREAFLQERDEPIRARPRMDRQNSRSSLSRARSYQSSDGEGTDGQRTPKSPEARGPAPPARPAPPPLRPA